jgi:linoleoyl-CoA desaturase
MGRLTWDEIGKHNHTGDCWIVIDGEVYDVTAWIGRHPGGQVIACLAGEDASAAFHGSHLRDISGILRAYSIGRVCDYESAFSAYRDDFYDTLKARVLAHFQRTGTDHRAAACEISGIVYTTLMLLGCWLFMYTVPVWGIIAAVPMGMATCALVGAFGHERIHGNLLPATSSRNPLSRIVNNTLWGVQIPFMPERYFQYEHIKHHGHPMKASEDYDVYALYPLLRLSPDTARKKHHALQHYYAPLVYSLYIFIQVVVGYVSPFFDKRRILRDDRGWFDVGMMKLVAVLFHIALPVYLTDAWWTLACASIYFMTWQSCIYMTSGLPHMTTDSESSDTDETWPHYVCRTTVNIKTGSRFFGWLCGGLNHHLTHHLLPSVPRRHLPSVTPIVRSTCAEFGYPYVEYDSFRRYYEKHVGYLYRMGCSSDQGAAGEKYRLTVR